MRRAFLILLSAICLLACAEPALASGGDVAFAGATAKEQATVRAALEASSFNWSLIRQTITVHVDRYGDSYSTYGNVYLDGALLDSGRFAWGVVQHEMAHQVDFFLLDDGKRAQLLQLLGGQDWCYSVTGLAHAAHGCERFASELAWAYWQSPDNAMKPTGPNDEAAAMPVGEFRALLAQLLGGPVEAQPKPATTRAFAPPAKKKRR